VAVFSEWEITDPGTPEAIPVTLVLLVFEKLIFLGMFSQM